MRRSLFVGTACLVALATGPATASAAPATEPAVPEDSLRALAGPAGLRVGVAVNTDLLGEDAEYTSLVDSQFSSVTPENVMKWQLVEPTRGTYDWSGADELVASAEANDQLVRGHTLVWHSQLPEWLQSTVTTTTDADGNTTDTSSLPPEELRALLEQHVKDVASRYRGRIWQWDVVNEAFTDDGSPRRTVWWSAWGGSTDYIADAFRWAQEADPHADLYYNDYNIEYAGPKVDAAHALVQQLQADGVPIDGVGFQTHLSTEYGFPDLRAQLQRFADLDLDVAETEVDVRTAVLPVDGQPAPAPEPVPAPEGGEEPPPADVVPDEGTEVEYTSTPASDQAFAAQQGYWTQSLQACLLVERCVAYTAWGVADGNSWIPGVFAGEGAALLYDDDYQPKPQLALLQQTLELSAGAPVRDGS